MTTLMNLGETAKNQRCKVKHSSHQNQSGGAFQMSKWVQKSSGLVHTAFRVGIFWLNNFLKILKLATSYDDLKVTTEVFKAPVPIKSR